MQSFRLRAKCAFSVIGKLIVLIHEILIIITPANKT